MKTTIQFIGTLAMASVAFSGLAVTGYWTGLGSSGSWTDAGNWMNGTIPGKTTSGGQVGDIAVFGPVAAGARTTVLPGDLASISNITFTGAGTPAYSFGTSASDIVVLESGNPITVDSTVTENQTFACVKNASSGATLHFRNDGSGIVSLTKILPNGSPNFYTLGTGDFSLDEVGNGPFFYFGHTGRTVMSGAAMKSLQPKSWNFNSRANVVIPEGRYALRAFDGGTAQKVGVWFKEDGEITGGGTYVVTTCGKSDEDGGSTPYALRVAAGKTVTISTPIANVNAGDGFMLYGDSGTTVFAATNGFNTKLTIASAATGRISDFDANLKRVATVRFGEGGGIFEYAGDSVTCTQRFVSLTANTATSRIRNVGSGTLTLTGGFEARAASTLALSAQTADIVLSTTLAATPTLALTVEGRETVTMAAAQSYTGVTTLSGGTLAAESPDILASTSGFVLNGGSLKFTTTEAATLSTTVTATAPGNVEFAGDATVSSFAVEGGGAINFVVPSGKTLKLTGAEAGLLPSTVTLNGDPAKVEADGTVIAIVSHWANAVDGEWSDDKWTAGVPTADHYAYLDAAGASYTVSMGDGDVFPAGLTLENGTEGETVTLALDSDRTVGNVPVRVNQGGVLLVTNMLDVSAIGGGWQPSGGTVLFENGATFKPTNDFTAGTCQMVFTNLAVCRPKGSNPVFNVRPSAAGETCEVVFANEFRDVSNPTLHDMQGGNLRVWSYPQGGRGIFTLRGTTKEYNTYFASNPYQLSVGYLTGHGEMNVLSGDFRSGNGGIMIGSGVNADQPYNPASWPDACCATGVVRMTGGGLYGNGTINAQTTCIGGFCIGYGAWIDNGNYGHGDFWYGRFELGGGIASSSGGFLIVGAGQGKGEIIQTGGQLLHRGDYASGGTTYHHFFAVGLFGGDGSYVISNGTANIDNNFFVGGAAVSDVNRSGNINSRTCTNRTDANGFFALRGGTVTCSSNVVVGANGTGTVEIGSSGTLTCAGNLAFSNQTASVLRVVPSADGTLASVSAHRLVIAEGARLVVDAKNISEECPALNVIAAEEVSGRFGQIEVENADEPLATTLRRGRILYEKNGGRGVWLEFRRGLMMIVK